MKHIIFTISFIVLLIFILPLGLIFAIKYIPTDFQPPLKDTKKIYGNFVYYQSFISEKDNLAAIGVSLKNPRLANKNYTFFDLYDDENKVIRKVSLKGENIADGKFVKIFFDPVTDSVNKRYTWSIYSPDSTQDDALEVFLTDQKPPWSTEFKVNDEVSSDSLSYVPLHKVSDPTTILGQVISDWTLKLTSDREFFVIYLGLVLSLFVYLIYCIFQTSTSELK